MKKSYLVRYQVSSGGDVFNCHLICNTLEKIEKRLHEHYLGICALYDEGNTFKILPDSPRFYELNEINMHVDLHHINDC